MKMLFHSAACTGLLFLGLLAPAQSQAQSAASAPKAAASATTQQQLDAYVQQFQQAGFFNGSALVAEKGKVLLQKGYGLANREQQVLNGPDTKFRIGSLTKQFTAALVLQLVEKGQLRLDGKVSDYLPTYPQPAGSQITLHHLLSHTAGLPDYTALPNFGPDIMRTHQEPAQLVALFAALPLQFVPGAQFQYSNSGYVLLGAIIEKVTGKPYAQVFQENIARPLKMKSTAYDALEPADRRRAAGYQATAKGLVNTSPLDMTVPYAAGAITSTVADMYRWNQALNGTKVLSAASKKLLFTPVKDNYAYGWMVMNAKMGPETIGLQEHNGGINGFKSYMVRVPQSQQLIILLDNHSGNSLPELRRGLLRILNHQPATLPAAVAGPAPASAAAVAVSEAALNSYVGVYELSPSFRIAVRQQGGKLFVQATGQSEFETEAASPVLFALKGVPAQVEFAKNDKGQVAQLILHQGGHDQLAAKIQ
ncbi:serine hydrolase [Hymenobacter sp. BT683]|uniref:Serine hydrolase n=1 Tax=Hymenobacter jeongseonensis TaxID=2791027 RepID=A0ABS0IJF2_9BACT|nr:serine hydrolase [Hymenobacter jeongseonensis]MBF9238468.1 serine hydrolase [Hymenobacter jeongseonensis]